jgi:hypothetical protein
LHILKELMVCFGAVVSTGEIAFTTRPRNYRALLADLPRAKFARLRRFFLAPTTTFTAHQAKLHRVMSICFRATSENRKFRLILQDDFEYQRWVRSC